jgi:hypothetical protein
MSEDLPGRFPADDCPRVVASNIKRIGNGTKVASFDLWIRKWRWTFYECLLHRVGDKEWIQLPGREYLDRHGNVRYAAIGRFDTDEITAALRKLTLAALRAQGEP